MRVEGDPDHPFTAGFACAKVNRDAELVHSPERIATPLRRLGAKGEGRFTPITWDAALDEITSRWHSIIAESGPLARSKVRIVGRRSHAASPSQSGQAVFRLSNWRCVVAPQ